MANHTTSDPADGAALQGQISRGERSTAGPAQITENAKKAEIAVLEALALSGNVITALLVGHTQRFRSRLLAVDHEQHSITVEAATDPAANVALLAQQNSAFIADVDAWRIEFIATAPRLVVHGELPAIEFHFPESIASQRRRMHDRAPVPTASQVRCIAYSAGTATFEGSILDISHGGIGMMQYDPAVRLEPGMVITNCRIERPGKEVVVVDLEVRFTETVTLPGGGRVQRAGCKFLSCPPGAMSLIKEFIRKPV